MYMVIKYGYDYNVGILPLYVEGFDSMESAMEFTKEKIRETIIDYGFEEGKFSMLDSADDERKSYPYYTFDVVNDYGDKKYRFDVIKFSSGNRVYL